MANAVTDNLTDQRYDIHVDGDLAGFAEYHVSGGVIAFLHTEIAQRYGGRGLAKQLIAFALDDARSKGYQVEPFCRFVSGFIKKNPEYRPLVAEKDWARFGLAD